MAGYIAITSGKWIDCLKNNRTEVALFWCKKKSFKALKIGEDFFFLRRSEFKTSADRFIVGKGSFIEFKRMPSNVIWSEYGNSVGFETKDEFSENIRKTYGSDVTDLGCIILGDIIFYDRPKSIKECEIAFSPYIVSGKTISDEECKKIKAIKEYGYE